VASSLMEICCWLLTLAMSPALRFFHLCQLRLIRRSLTAGSCTHTQPARLLQRSVRRLSRQSDSWLAYSLSRLVLAIGLPGRASVSAAHVTGSATHSESPTTCPTPCSHTSCLQGQTLRYHYLSWFCVVCTNCQLLQSLVGLGSGPLTTTSSLVR